MPLDTGDTADGLSVGGAEDQLARLRPVKVVLDRNGHVGAALKAARESLGLVEEDIAQVTRVRCAHIAAIEVFDFDSLPARPFVVGYVRAYAMALGLEPGTVVARFHAEAPKVDGKLRAPGGVRHDAFANIRWFVVVGAVIAAAVAVWNVERRAELQTARPAEIAPHLTTPSNAVAGPAEIGGPLPTPPEATTPPVYQTPGLDAADAAKLPLAAAGAHASPAPGLTDTTTAPIGTPFVPAGTIFGATNAGAGVILQARKATSLVIRGAGGAVYFARLLNPGEAWRAPTLAGLTADVGDPGSVEVFVASASRGRLNQPLTPLSRLDVAAPRN